MKTFFLRSLSNAGKSCNLFLMFPTLRELRSTNTEACMWPLLGIPIKFLNSDQQKMLWNGGGFRALPQEFLYPRAQNISRAHTTCTIWRSSEISCAEMR